MGSSAGASECSKKFNCFQAPTMGKKSLPGLPLQELPTLVQLLETTLDLRFREVATNNERNGQEGEDSCPLDGKRPKLMLLGSLLSSSLLSSSSSGDRWQGQIIVGIPSSEFQNDPGVLLALRRLLSVLKTVIMGYGNNVTSRNCQSLQLAEVKVEEEEKLDEKEVEKAVAKSLEEIKHLSLYTWEQLNVGHWKTVPRFWRKLYTCLKILKVAFMAVEALPMLEIIKECDMGLLMGEPLCENVLSKIAEELSTKIRTEAAKRSTPPFPLRNKTENECQVIFTHQPCLTEFKTYMTGSTPCLLLNIVNHWPALNKWSVDYIEEVAGFRTVPVEIGQRYTSEDWTQKLMTISDFIEKHMRTSPWNPNQEIGYIAQYTLFNQLPELRKDIRIPDYCLISGENAKENVEINGWFGPANTISPCHYDPKHNILVQVFGSKAIRLFPPSESSILQPFPETSLLFNTSQLDVEAEDLFERAPEMRNVTHYDLTLGPGQALYIPPKWWHYVKSLSPSFSVSFWFDDEEEGK